MSKVNLFGSAFNSALVGRVSAVNIFSDWAAVNPSPGNFDYSLILKAAELWQKASVPINLIFTTTSDLLTGPFLQAGTPAWMWDELGPENYTSTCNGGQRLPNYFHPAWIAGVRALIQSVVRVFAGGVGYIRMNVGHGGEALPAEGWNDLTTPCGKQFAKWGFTWATWMDYLSNRYGDLAVASRADDVQWVVTITGGGNAGGAELPDFIASVANSLGIGFGSQGFSPADVKNGCAKTAGNWCQEFKKFPGVPHELQTAGVMGTQLLTMLPFAVANGATEIELYPEDFYNPALVAAIAAAQGK